ncbi:uncharacterized protein B0I36DRAFT_433991 [Microdochium trichocladiopsis]|uniref:Uncharacterized protein n=1 Tax=Microdochium trichocladiopsis TaxID=1682393 RepID=A0A9P8Y0M1_9PEZI|nr:uncharacterized protein B0I36DRAFT_433991 [Microdochium trichocladiopsis]KAH7026582.1 hypothetical protein B0I36DRAFT_433991 [Microdochium trichocladiopsis]
MQPFAALFVAAALVNSCTAGSISLGHGGGSNLAWIGGQDPCKKAVKLNTASGCGAVTQFRDDASHLYFQLRNCGSGDIEVWTWLGFPNPPPGDPKLLSTCRKRSPLHFCSPPNILEPYSFRITQDWECFY